MSWLRTECPGKKPGRLRCGSSGTLAWLKRKPRCVDVVIRRNLFSDVKYGLRALRHNPVFTIVVLLTISIGIAANAVVFTVVNSVLLKPLHYPGRRRLWQRHQVAPGAEGLADFEMVFYCRVDSISPTPSTTGHFNPWGCGLGPARRTLQALPCRNRSGQLA